MPKDNKYIIIRERPHKLAPVYWNSVSQTSSKTKKIHGINFSVIWGWHESGRQIQFYLKSDWDRVADYIANRIYNDKAYFQNIKKYLAVYSADIFNLFKKIKKKDIKKISFLELISLAQEIKELWLNYDCANVLPWFSGGDIFQDRVRNDLGILEKDFLFLTTPIGQTASSKLEENLFKYAKKSKENKKKIDSLATRLSDNYGWIPFGYNGPVYWDKKYFVTRLNSLLKKHSLKYLSDKLDSMSAARRADLARQKSLIKKYQLNKKQLDNLEKINCLNIWTDDRKHLQYKLHYYYDNILSELERRHKIPHLNLQYLFTKELSDVEKNTDNIIKKTNTRIKNGFMIEFRRGQGGVLEDKSARLIRRELEGLMRDQKIQGMVASQGTKNLYRARVKIVLSPDQATKIKKGEFLVATMTSPDYLLAMKKAAGFITDEGGVTCHAAIVAREMNKPCLIATRTATKILKDNYLIELDVQKGLVKIIK